MVFVLIKEFWEAREAFLRARAAVSPPGLAPSADGARPVIPGTLEPSFGWPIPVPVSKTDSEWARPRPPRVFRKWDQRFHASQSVQSIWDQDSTARLARSHIRHQKCFTWAGCGFEWPSSVNRKLDHASSCPRSKSDLTGWLQCGHFHRHTPQVHRMPCSSRCLAGQVPTCDDAVEGGRPSSISPPGFLQSCFTFAASVAPCLPFLFCFLSLCFLPSYFFHI